MNIATLVTNFTNQLTSLIERETLDRARAAVVGALGPGNGRGAATKALAFTAGRARKKAPKQLCPVPGCKNPAAPVFGMVCSEHKGLPKAKIKAYREARRQAKVTNGASKRAAGAGAKAGAAAAKPAARKVQMTPK